MGISTVMDNLIVLQAAITTAHADVSTIKKAWKFIPPGNADVPEEPCFMNTFSFTREERNVSLRKLFYTIEMRLYVGDADSEQDHRAEQAIQFHEALVDALDADVTLSNSMTPLGRRGSDPTLVVIEHSGKGHLGIVEYMDIQINEAKTFT